MAERNDSVRGRRQFNCFSRGHYALLVVCRVCVCTLLWQDAHQKRDVLVRMYIRVVVVGDVWCVVDSILI